MYAKGPFAILPSLVTFIIIVLYDSHSVNPKQGADAVTLSTVLLPEDKVYTPASSSWLTEAS